MVAYNNFKKIMEEYNALLDKLILIENEKISIVAEDDLKLLDGNMRKEEAEVLRMRGIDRKRETLLKKAGCEGRTFKQVMETLKDDERAELLPLYSQMADKTERLKGLSASASRMLESKLIRLDNTAARAGMQAGYDQNGGLKQDQADIKPRMKPTSA